MLHAASQIQDSRDLPLPFAVIPPSRFDTVAHKRAGLSGAACQRLARGYEALQIVVLENDDLIPSSVTNRPAKTFISR